MKIWSIATILSLGLFCVSPKLGNVCSLLVILYLFISMLTLMYLKKLENQSEKTIKIIVLSIIIESILMLFLVISFIAMEIYLWNGQNILDTGSALLAIIPSSLYNSVGVLVDVLGLICLIVSFINLIHIYENKANLAIERNELI